MPLMFIIESQADIPENIDEIYITKRCTATIIPELMLMKPGLGVEAQHVGLMHCLTVPADYTIEVNVSTTL